MRAACLCISVLVLLGGCSPQRKFAMTSSAGGAAGDSDESMAGSNGGAAQPGNEPGSAADFGGANDAGSGGRADGGASGSSTGEGGMSGNGNPDCGDGNVDKGEECDNGSENGPGKACNARCLLNVCGDGDQGPGEGCDSGAENGMDVLRCAPDCSRIIEIKHLVVAATELGNSRLQPNPVATADATCRSGYKAFFVYGTQRRATTTAFKAQNSIDWVLRPYTYYYNDVENPLWLTDSVPLLGVRNGHPMPLQNAISQATEVILTGLNEDYTTLGSDNCDGWSTIQTTYSKHYGLPPASDIGFMYSTDTLECGSYAISFYCVEQ